MAWTSENSNNTQPDVKTKASNELGLYDMSGGVYEFVHDESMKTYYYYCGGSYLVGKNTAGVNPISSQYANEGSKYNGIGCRIALRLQ